MICWLLRKHKWDYQRDMCSRCNKTAAAICAGAVTTEKLVDNEAYWRGVKDGCEAGRRQERKRAYSVGRKRGARLMHAEVMKVLGR